MHQSARQKNRRMIAYACSYVPVEIIMASGMTARRIIPEAPAPTQTQCFLHANTCCYVKSLLAQMLDGQHPPYRGIIIANSCDAMRRLYDLLERYGEKMPAVFLDIPQKKDADSVRFFASVLRRLAEDVATAFDAEPATDERLNAAIKECNAIRTSMGDVFKTPGIPGSELFRLCLHGAQSEPGEFAAAIRRCRAETATNRSVQGARRVVLTGNVLLHSDLITLIEAAGAQIAGLDICMGARHFETLVEEDGSDPFAALSLRYLTRPACSRMLGVDEQLAYLTTLCTDTKADGVICSVVKYCDPLVYTIPMLQMHCKQAGIPFLCLENEYAWSYTGQTRTRIETFLELLENKYA